MPRDRRAGSAATEGAGSCRVPFRARLGQDHLHLGVGEAVTLPVLPTHVVGSHGFSGWFWTALDRIKAGDYGQTDVKEMFDDATQLAIRDQSLEPLEPLRQTGLYAYDSVPHYRPAG